MTDWEKRQEGLYMLWLADLVAWAGETGKLSKPQQLSLANVQGKIPLDELRQYNAKRGRV